ncbi:MAG TPA: DUF1998 domain-containing protein, partial [Dermatophilaceae bacterium]|nr:DUF1998 domain-containing protein [Dermatophilaceae bacterium]
RALVGTTAPTGRGATALYLAPTKALAHDQLARIDALALPGLRAATYDGDTEPDERRWVREHAAYVLTNPDLLHHSLLPGHEHWAPFLRALRYVVVDECHVYRGVFGSHVALVLRRLRRVCERYRVAPTFVLASATVAEPAAHAERLIGMPVRPVTRDGSPRGAVTVGLWEPMVAADRRSAVSESAELMAELVRRGVQTVAFTRSRAGAEALAGAARRHLGAEEESAAGGAPREGTEVGGAGAAGIAAYRGGYLPEERRALETALRDGRLRGLAATTALELGVDVSGLDAVLVAGWPGTLASFWQQVGRAGRSGGEALAVLVAADDPLDAYLVEHPEAVFDRPVEAAVLDPGNPRLLEPQIACAAADLPLKPGDLSIFGAGATVAAERLVAQGVLRRRPAGLFPALDRGRPSDGVTLRGVGGSVRVVERRTGRVLGVVDGARADRTVHEGAVYLHQGESHVVVEVDADAGCALVVAGDPGWTTQARSVSGFQLGGAERRGGPARSGGDPAGVAWGLGPVIVRTQVVSFLRVLPDGRVVGEHRLDLPERCLETVGVWLTVAPELLASIGVDGGAVAGALHAIEHAATGVLPLVASADRFDVGGASAAYHSDTGLPTVLVHDGYPGGAGFAERGYAALPDWLGAAAEAVRRCGCELGCLSCVQSPTCGSGNAPLDKVGALAVLEVLVRQVRVGERRGGPAAE